MRGAFRPLRVLRRRAKPASASSRESALPGHLPHARPETAQCRTRRCRVRDRRHTSWKTSASPSQSRPIQAAPGPGGWLARQISAAIRSASAAKISSAGRRPRGANRRRARNAGRSRRFERAGILPDHLDLPGDLLRVETGGAGARAIAGPRAPAVGTEMPPASRISLPSLGDTKCGTFNATSAARSARCNGQSGSASFSQSASRAMKSACADQITPSFMLRWFFRRCSSM